MFKVTARDQGHYKGPSGAFVTYCNISCFILNNSGDIFDAKMMELLKDGWGKDGTTDRCKPVYPRFFKTGNS